MSNETIAVSGSHVSAELACKRSGHGPAIVFLHGWAHSAEVWQQVTPHFEPNYTCLAIDFPGFGKSSPLPKKQTKLSVYAEITWRLLLTLSQRQRISGVVADSMGALLIIDCLSRFEKLPISQYFLSGVPLDGLPKLVRDTHADAFTGAGLRVLRALPFTLAHLLTSRSNHLTVHQRGKFERIITNMVRASHPTTAGRVLREMYYPHELSANFMPGRYSITLCRGANDLIFRKSALEPWAQALGARSVEVPEAGHTPMLEKPDDYARAIINAWQGAETASIQGS